MRHTDILTTDTTATMSDAELAEAHIGYLFADEQIQAEAERRWPVLASLSLSITVLTEHAFEVAEAEHPDRWTEPTLHDDAINAIRTAYRKTVEAIANGQA